jgi:hypothetical protein
MTKYIRSNNIEYVIEDNVGVNFISSTDGESIGVGLEVLSIPLEQTANPWPDYCNYTITPTDLDNCLQNNRNHFYPVFIIRNRIYACNNPKIIDIPLMDKWVSITGLAHEKHCIAYLVYRVKSKIENTYHLKLDLEFS